MVIPLYFVPMLSSLPTGMRKQHTSRQHSIQGSIQGDNNSTNTPVSLYAPIVWLRSLSLFNSLLRT